MTYSGHATTRNFALTASTLRLFAGRLSARRSWDMGHEYVRHIAAELGEEFSLREAAVLEAPEDADKAAETKKKDKLPGTIQDLRDLAKQCATFLLGHNAEPDAVDLLEEMEIIGEITQLVDENNYSRVCQYMIRCVNLLPPPDDLVFLRTAHTIYVQHKKFPESLALAIRLGDADLIRDDFHAPGNP